MLLPYTLILRISSFIDRNVVNEPNCTNIIYDNLAQLIDFGLLAPIFTSLLLFLEAILLNQMVIKNRLTHELSLLPGMLYILCFSVLAEFIPLHPILLANLFIILFLKEMFKIVKHPRPYVLLLRAGIFGAIASLFFFPYTLTIVLGILIINSLRTIKIIEVFQFLTGYILIYLILYSILYFLGLGHSFFNEQWFANFHIPIEMARWAQMDWISAIVIFCLILIPAGLYTSFLKKKSLNSRKKITLTFQWMALCLLSLLMSCEMLKPHVLVLAIPLSICYSIIILRSKKGFVFEILHLLCVALILNTHFDFIPFNF